MLFSTLLIAVVHYLLKSNVFAYLIIAIGLHFIDTQFLSEILKLSENTLGRWLFLYPYVLLGFLFARYKDKIFEKLYIRQGSSLLIYTIIFGLLNVATALFFKYEYTVYEFGIYVLSDFPKSLYVLPLRFVAGVSGSAFWLALFSYLGSKNIPKYIDNAVKKVSDNSIVIYVFCSYVLGNVLIDFISLPAMSLELYIVLDVFVNLLIGVFVAEVIKMTKITRRLFVGGR